MYESLSLNELTIFCGGGGGVGQWWWVKVGGWGGGARGGWVVAVEHDSLHEYVFLSLF